MCAERGIPVLSFEIPDEVAYFNLASLAPQLRSVRAAGEEALAARAAPWRISSQDWFDEVELLRALFAQVIGADADGVALIPATSYGLAIAAHNSTAEPGDRVVLVADECPSTVHTWRAFAARHGAEVITLARHASKAGPIRCWLRSTSESGSSRYRTCAGPMVP